MIYKIVRRLDNNNRVSIITEGAMRLHYSRNAWTKAAIGGILCFDNLDNAKSFIKSAPWCQQILSNLEVWEVAVQEPVTLRKYCHPSWIDYDRAKAAWGDAPSYFYVSVYPSDTWPKGTVAFKSIMLQRRLKEGEYS